MATLVLRRARQHRDLLLREVCEATGLHVSALSLIERGLRSPTTEQRARLAEYYGQSEATLFALAATEAA